FDLRRRVRELERRGSSAAPAAPPAPARPQPPAPAAARPRAAPSQPSTGPSPPPSPASAPAPGGSPARNPTLSEQLRAPVARPAASAVAAARLVRWFTTGNVIAKVGMLVLLAGVAALLKYASDQGWLSVPIGWRLAGVAAAALAGLAFGWRQRGTRRVFALTLQGGAIGVLLLVVYAAFQLYGLLPVAPAF